MRETLEFTLDLIEIVPNNSILYIQCSSLDNSRLEKLITNSKYDWAKQIILDSENKIILKNLLLEIQLEDEFQSVNIEKDDVKVAEAYDGMEIGEISQTINIPKWFEEKYVKNNYCIVSKTW